MTEPSKIPATISIDSRMQDVVVNTIDDTDYMLLSKSTVPHGELFLYAMALGWNKKLKPEMDKPTSGGFIRSESFSPKLSTLIETVHYAVVGFDSPDELRDHRKSFKIAEQYAAAFARGRGRWQYRHGDDSQRAHRRDERHVGRMVWRGRVVETRRVHS